MCEVEFWEVFKVMFEGFVGWLPLPSADCRIADLENSYLLFVIELNEVRNSILLSVIYRIVKVHIQADNINRLILTASKPLPL
jgi:hypothetical protein